MRNTKVQANKTTATPLWTNLALTLNYLVVDKHFSKLQSQRAPKGAYEPNTNDPQTTKKDIDYVKCIDSLTIDLDFLTIATYLQRV